MSTVVSAERGPAAACAVCERPLARGERAAGVCAGEACRRAYLAGLSDADAIAARGAALVGQARALRDRVAPAPPGVDPEEHAPVVVVPGLDPADFPFVQAPTIAAPVVPLVRRRVAALRARVHRLAEEARAAPRRAPAPVAHPPEPAPEHAALLAAGCVACGGRCCRTAGDHAHLSADTLRAWLADHPRATAVDAAEAYAAHVPARSVAGSCVFDRGDGCALPRAMRSATCNRYYCDGLVRLRGVLEARAAAGRPVARVFAAAAELGGVTRGALGTAGGARVVEH